MSIQEMALYGDLVLYLRDQVAKILVEEDIHNDLDKANDRLDSLIRNWFFTPQEDLYGLAPREVIWREQLDMPNPIPPEYAHDAFDDDCPICQGAIEEIESGEHNHAHGNGWNWTYCPDTSLLDIYDPEGSEERWEKERLWMQPQLDQGPEPSLDEIPTYAPPATDDLELSPDEFMERLNWRPRIDKRLQEMALRFIERFDCPIHRGLFGPDYRRLTEKECLTLIKGLEKQGIDLDELSNHLEAWPYKNVALDWLSEPERHAYFIIKSMETRLDPADKSTLISFRQHRDFYFVLQQIIPYNARLWLQGWLEGIALGQKAENQDQDHDRIEPDSFPF
ncbi:hypothetical protein QUF58_04270 [Anaerolineales bacterium HSG24]|nr:hypothetical protein [Anaerolineales bacterium HSG24]